MPFVSAPNIVMAEVRATLDSQQIENRVMIDVLAPVTPTLVAAVATLFDTWVEDVYFPILPHAVALREVVATDMTTDTGTQVTVAPVGAVIGGLSNDAMPNEVTFCISLRSAARGRSARGRMFMLALQVPDVAGNTLAVGRAITFAAALNTLIASVAAAGWNLVIVSYNHGGGPRVGGPVYFPVVTALYTDLIVDSQRKRKPGVGS